METIEITRQKAKPIAISLYPKHQNLLREIRTSRAVRRDDVPSASNLVQRAIEDLARREIEPERFEELMAGAA